MAVKARLVFASPEGEAWLGPFPVSFNPESLSIQIGAGRQESEQSVNASQGVNQKEPQPPVIQMGGASVKNVSMQLMFDMVELYRQTVNSGRQKAAMDKVSALVSSFDSANLMESAMSGVGILMKPTDYTQVSLLNPQYSCFSLLEQAAANNLPVGFLWGAMQFLGVLTSFSSQFVYFSDQGAPLRAEVSLSIQCGQGDPEGEAVMDKAEAEQKAEAGRAQPGAE